MPLLILLPLLLAWHRENCAVSAETIRFQSEMLQKRLPQRRHLNNFEHRDLQKKNNGYYNYYSGSNNNRHYYNETSNDTYYDDDYYWNDTDNNDTWYDDDTLDDDSSDTDADGSANTDADADSEDDYENSNEDDNECRQLEWSKCNSICDQSRPIYTKKSRSDTKCYKDKEEHRVCHVDECAKLYHCIVPVRVTSVLKFVGDLSSHPMRFYDEEKFISSYAIAINKVRDDEPNIKKKKVVIPGDITINVQNTDKISGFSITVDVSIVNNRINVLDFQKKVNKKMKFKEKVKKFADHKGVETCEESDLMEVHKKGNEVDRAVADEEFPAVFMKELAMLYNGGKSKSLKSSVFEKAMKNYVEDNFQVPQVTNTEMIINSGSNSEKGKNSNATLFIILGTISFLLCACGLCFGSHIQRRQFDSLGVTSSVLDALQNLKSKKDHKVLINDDENDLSLDTYHDELDFKDEPERSLDTYHDELDLKDEPEKN